MTALGIAAVVSYFIWLIWRRRWIADDGLIVLRTVRNVLEGNGPVFNQLERVEANTSTLWTWLLVLVSSFTGGDLGRVAVVVGGVCSVVGMLIAFDATRRLLVAAGLGGAFLPAGALVVLAVFPFWNYSTSGLEGGLCMLWISCIWWATVVLLDHGTTLGRLCWAALVGLGPLVRPDFALISAVFFVAGLLRARVSLRRGAALVAAAGALPVAYEVFRAGYYGLLVPLPALTKSASGVEWARGYSYFLDFVKPYHLYLPLGLLVVAMLGPQLRRALSGRWLLIATPVVAGAVHALFIIRVGGDFMHGRMMLPATWLVLLPLLLVPVGRVSLVVVLALVVWGVPTRMRSYPPDERIGYVRFTGNRHPASVAAYVESPYVAPQVEYVQKILKEKNRQLFSEGGMVISLGAVPVPVAYFAGRLGVGSTIIPLEGFVVDSLGLSNPIGARITKTNAGDPGHEKVLPADWVIGDVADDATVAANAKAAAAKRALRCGDLRELLESVREPMTASRFWRNILGSVRRTRLEIPADPVEAERTFCGT